MPHLTLEYTDNLDFEVQPVLRALHEALVATGAVAMKGLKSRAVRRDQWRIADGNEGYAFAHLTIVVREGRPHEVRADIAERALAVLQDAFRARREEGGYLSLSVDVREMVDGVALTDHDIPAGGVVAGGGA